MRELDSALDSREIFSKVPTTVKFDLRFNDTGDYVFIFSNERVILNFSYLGEERLFDLSTTSVLNLDRKRIMLSLVKGIGILGRGGPLRYISSEIDSLIGSSLFDSPTTLDVSGFNEKDLYWNNWGEELRAITLEFSDIKSISIEGKEVESKIKELNLYPNNESTIKKIKVYNKSFNRDITIEKNGKIMMALWTGDIGINKFERKSFLEFSDKITKFYEYVEGATGEGHEASL